MNLNKITEILQDIQIAEAAEKECLLQLQNAKKNYETAKRAVKKARSRITLRNK